MFKFQFRSDESIAPSIHCTLFVPLMDHGGRNTLFWISFGLVFICAVIYNLHLPFH